MRNADKTVKVTTELRDAIDLESAQTRLPMYRLLEIAWDLYKRYKHFHEAFGKTLALSGPVSHTTKRTEEISLVEWQQIEKVLRIYRSGNETAIGALDGNIEIGLLLVKIDATKRAK